LCYYWSFPYYLIGVGVASLISYSSQYVGWRTSLLILPIMYLIHLHHQLSVERHVAEDRIKA